MESSTTISETSKVKTSPSISIKKQPYGTFIFDKKTRRVFSLNPTAADILQYCQEPSTPKDITNTIIEKNDGIDPNFITEHTLIFLQNAIKVGLIQKLD